MLSQDVGEGWWEAKNERGERGLVPESYLEVRDQDIRMFEIWNVIFSCFPAVTRVINNDDCLFFCTR